MKLIRYFEWFFRVRETFSFLVASASAIDRFTNYNRLVLGTIPEMVDKYPGLIDGNVYSNSRTENGLLWPTLRLRSRFLFALNFFALNFFINLHEQNSPQIFAVASKWKREKFRRQMRRKNSKGKPPGGSCCVWLLRPGLDLGVFNLRLVSQS